MTPVTEPGLRAPALSPQPVTDPLTVVAVETERYVAAAGWDQPVRLFALVPSAELLAAEPALAEQAGLSDKAPGALSAVEQDGLPEHDLIEDLLAGLAWPPSVTGVLVAVERIVLPPGTENSLGDAGDASLAALADHPDRVDIRLVAAVTRAGERTCVLRQRAHDRDDRVARGAEIAPGLLDALAATLA